MSDLSEIAQNPEAFVREFLRENPKYESALLSDTREKPILVIDRRDIVGHNHELAEFFKQYPETALEAFRNVASEIAGREVYVTLKGVPEQPIRSVMTIDNLGRLVAFKGIVTKATNVIPRLKKAVFQCPMCGELYEVENPSASILRNPPKCPKCKVRTRFVERLSEFEDFQVITVQERTEDIPTGATPTSVDCLLKRPLIYKVSPGDSVKVIGILRYAPGSDLGLGLKFGGALSLYVEVIGIEAGDVEDESLELTEREKEFILSLIESGKAVEAVKRSIAPGIKGYDIVKEAIAYQLFVGVNKVLPDGTRIRGNIHILLIGDPGIGKSQILRSVANIAPRAIFTTGEGSTGAGLTAAAIRGEKGFVLEAGALVLADNGIACIDEFDKMRKEDREKLHEAMEQQSFHPDTEILLTNGERKRIGELVDALMLMFSDQVQETEHGKRLDLPPFVAIYVPSNTLVSAAPMKIVSVAKRKAPKKLYRVKLESGNELVVTPEHPFLVLRGNEIVVKPASELRPGDRIPVSSEVYIYERPGTINENLARIMARFIIDGVLGERSIAVKRVPEEVDKVDRNRLKEAFMDAMIRFEDDYVRIRSTSLMDFLHDNCEELFDRRVPAALVRESPVVIAAFLEEFFLASSGRIDDKKLAEDLQLLFSRLGRATRIIEFQGKYTLMFYDERPDYREVVEVEEIDSDVEYVYDVLVEPTNILVLGSGAMIHNSISISKAGITASLNARAAILAAANPKYGRFVPGKPIDEQIDLPPPILSRFDLIFPLKDEIDEQRDREIANHIVEVRSSYEAIEPIVPPKLLKKRIYYARKHVHPRIPSELRKYITDFYVKLRQGSKESAYKITPRQLESILRLAEARARLHLRDTVTKEDVDAAIRIINYFINEVLGGDIDVLYGMSREEREKAMKIDEAIIEVLERFGSLHKDDLIREVQMLTGAGPEEIKKAIRKLYETGRIMEIEPNVYAL